MTTRLYCRECGWQSESRRKRTAMRAARRHCCTATPLAEMHQHWWIRLWATLWTGKGANAIDAVTDTEPETHDRDGEMLAAHHAETTRRARRAMAELVRAGYQIGPPPYGYRALRIRVTAPTGHSRLRTVLVPDWQTAAVVRQIFNWRVDYSLNFTVIAERLNADVHQYPPPAQTGRWSAKAVHRIVTNPKYVGRQVWARSIAGRPAPIDQWVTSAPMAHEPLVDERTFQRAQPCRTTEGGDRAHTA